MADDTIDLRHGVPVDSIPADGVLAGEVEGTAVMIARLADAEGAMSFSALDATCTHAGAPLQKGLRTGDGIRCPFHHACFDLRTGEAVLAPAYKPLQRWKVVVQDGVVRVTDRAETAVVPPVTNSRGVRSVVVVGGGAAGFAVVERLRRVGYDGTLTMVTAEPDVPIDRTKLSKGYLAGDVPADGLPLLPTDWYTDHDVVLHTDTLASAIDTAARTVTLDTGATLPYDALVLATGSTPSVPDVAGFERDEVRLLRSKADADAVIARAAGATQVLIVGAGFIGLEVAAALRDREVPVTVVARSEIPLAGAIGPDLGAVVKATHEEHGVRFVVGQAVRWTGTELELEDGTRLPADFVVVGTGVTPDTALAEQAGLAIDDGVIVDEFGETSVPGVFAAGDIARFPSPVTGERIRVEHWAQAERAGALAAVNLLGAGQPQEEPPYFWSKHWSTNVRVSGTPSEDAVPDRTDAGLLVRYREHGRLTGAAGTGRDLDVLVVEQELVPRSAD